MRIIKLPPQLFSDNSRQEVLRVWLDEGKISLAICHKLSEGFRQDPLEVWPIFLSDIFHHVVDALVLETKNDRAFVQSQFVLHFEKVMRSERETGVGAINKYNERLSELPTLGLSNNEANVEITRVILSKGMIDVLVRVGMWLPDEEEVWGNLLYDLIYMIASTIRPENFEEIRDLISQEFRKYISKPTTHYSGNYYDS